MTQYHLAQINVALMRAPLDDPLMAGFVSQLDSVNAVAERSPGFIWRLQTESGNATDIQAFDDERILVNMSVWASVEALYNYTYNADHLAAMRQRQQWFEPYPGPFLALWWIQASHRPSVSEGKARLSHLAHHGPGCQAFTFKERFDPIPDCV